VTGRWLGAAFWGVLGVVIAWQARAHGMGTFAEPGPGMIAFGLGVGMALIGVGRAFAAAPEAHRPPDAQSQGAPREVPWRVIALCALLAAYFLLLSPLGYMLSTFALLLVLLTAFSGIRWPVAAAVALLFVLASWAVFKLALKVQLPAGLLG
jgi:hypothetical protein